MTNLPAPEELTGGSDSLFLAGPVANCGPWRRRLAELLLPLPITLIDPTRADYAALGPGALAAHVAWERRHQGLATWRLFWFAPPTRCAITLYELGAWSMTDAPLFVGVHPRYPHRHDVEVRTRLVRPDVTIAASLEELAQQVLALQAGSARTEVLR
jgi:hypothetical protein